MVTVAVCSQKGGSGKSTVVSGLADAFLASGRTVALYDTDAPQHTLKRWHTLAGGQPRLAGLIVEAHSAPDLHRKALAAVDVRLIDCPGRIDSVVRSAMAVADALLVPLQPTYADTWALQGLADTMVAAVKARGRPLPAFVVLNRLKPRTRLAREADGLAAAMPAGFTLLRARLRDLQAFQVALGLGDTPLGLEPSGAAASDLRQLAAELETLLRKPSHAQQKVHRAAASRSA